MSKINKSSDKIVNTNFLLFFGTVFFLFFALDFYIPVLPFYVLKADGSETAIGLLMGVFTFFSIILRPFQGRNLNIGNRKRLLLAGILLYTIAGLGLLILPSLPLLFLFRALQGIGWGAFLLAFNTITLDLAPPHRRGEVVGLVGVAPPLSLAVAPALGHYLMINTAENYFFLFLIAAFIALLSFIAASLVKEPDRRKGEAENQSRALFSKKVLFPSFVVLCMTFNLGAILAFLPLFGEARNIENMGSFFTVFASTLLFARPLAGKLSDRLGREKIFIPALVIASSALVMLSLVFSLETALVSAFILGLGFGSAHSSIMALAADRLPVMERGIGMATFTASFDLGIVIGSITFGSLLSWLDFNGLFVLGALIMMLPIPTYIILKRLRLKMGESFLG